MSPSFGLQHAALPDQGHLVAAPSAPGPSLAATPAGGGGSLLTSILSIKLHRGVLSAVSLGRLPTGEPASGGRMRSSSSKLCAGCDSKAPRADIFLVDEISLVLASLSDRLTHRVDALFVVVMAGRCGRRLGTGHAHGLAQSPVCGKTSPRTNPAPRFFRQPSAFG